METPTISAGSSAASGRPSGRSGVRLGFRAVCLTAIFAAAGLLGPGPLSGGNGRGVPPVDRSARVEPANNDTLNVVIAATTDSHGWVRGWDYFSNRPDTTRGLTRIATIVDSVRNANPGRVILVDAGDFLQGNPLTYVAGKVAPQQVHPVIAAMNLMKYDIAVPGNHEFDYGLPFFHRVQLQAKFDMPSANVRSETGGAHLGTYKLITPTPGLMIGLVGATTVSTMGSNGDLFRAEHVRVSSVVPALREAVKAARAAHASAVVAVLHTGLSAPATDRTVAGDTTEENVADIVAREVPGIDLIVFGHTHGQVVDTTINGVMLMQPRQWAGSLGIAQLTFTKSGADWKLITRRGSAVAAVGHRESPAILSATNSAHDAAVRWVTSPVGKTTARWRSDSARVVDSPIVDFVGEVMRREAKADLAATAAFSLDIDIRPGTISMAQLAALYPYDNTLRAVRIDGATLLAFLEQSARYYKRANADGTVAQGTIVDPNVAGYNFDIMVGVDYDIDLRRPAGQRISRLTFRGKPVAPTDTFTMATNNYRQGGGGGYTMLRGLPVTYSKQVEIRQLLIDEAQRVGTLQPERYFEANWKIIPAAIIGRAYAEQNPAWASSNATGNVTANTGLAPQQPGRQSPNRTLRVITTSDFHAGLEGRRDERGRIRGGAVALKSAIETARRECRAQCTSITVDAGDLFSGSPASDWTAGKPTVAAINRLGISAGAIGNHEFDFGQDTLRMRLRELKHRVLGINVIGADGKMPAWLKGDTIVVRDGLRIGIIGAASMYTASNTKRRAVQGLRFLDAAPIVSARIKQLRAQNLDAVIVTIHEGARCTIGLSDGCEGSGIEFVKKLTEKPDVVVLGHAHTNMVLNINGIPAVQVFNSGRGIGVIDIPLRARNAATANVRDVIGDSVNVDAVLDTIVKNAVRRVSSRLSQPVATIKVALNRPGEQYPLGNLIADAVRVMGNGDFGSWNNGGIRTDIPAGPLNFGGVHEVTPFGNSLAKLSMRGRDIRAFIEGVVRGRNPDSHVSGLLVEYDASRPAGERVTSLRTADGGELDPNRIYTMVVNDYMLDELQANRPEIIVSAEVLRIVDAPAIAEYMKRLPQPVVAPQEVRIRQTGGAR